MRRKRRHLWFFLSLATIIACAATPPPLPVDFAGGDPAALSAADSLRESVSRVAGAAWNPGRLSAARERARELGLEGQGRSEWIDWFTIQRNYLIEIPGRGGGLAYVVAHYDKTDANPLKFVSLLTNGLIDELVGWSYLSQGAHDNASGVALALELGRALRQAEPRLTWRILLAGAEESGLRGSRAHAARFSDGDWERLRFVVNIDSVGKDDRPNCLMENASDPRLAVEAFRVAKELGIPLGRGQIPSGAMGDHVSFMQTSFRHDLVRGLMFNLVGGLLPQRSWFTGSHGTQVLTVASCDVVGIADFVAGSILIPVGRLHGPRDRASSIDVVKLHEQFTLLRALLLRLDAGD